MQPIIRPTVTDVITELQRDGWQRNGKLRQRPPFTFHHPVKSKQAAVVQQLPSGKGHAHFQTNW